MKTQAQSGSVLSIVAVCLALALSTALGWIFWQNFVHEEPKALVDDSNIVADRSETIKQAEASADVYKGWLTYTDKEHGYSLAYPSDWTLDSDSDAVNIRSSDAKYLSITVEGNDQNSVAIRSGLTAREFYDELGKSEYVQHGAVSIDASSVKTASVGGMSAKSAKVTFNSANEDVYVLNNDRLINISLHPYGLSSDEVVAKILGSFKL